MKLKSLALVALVTACGSSTNSQFDTTDPDAGGTNPDGGCDFCTGDGGFNNKGDGAAACIPDPANYDIPGNGCDDDGNGKVDDTPVCDNGLPASGTAMQAAQAMGLCQNADATHWGVVSAKFTQGTASAPDAHQTSILGSFGNALKPLEGSSLAVLSSGYASAMDSCPTNQRFSNLAGNSFKFGCAMTGMGAAPAGFPKSAGGCPSQMGAAVNDVVDFQVQIKVPANANGFAFNFDFGSGEWPEYVCSPFNDSFIAYLKSTAFNNGTADNISFDSKNNPVSVNNGFFGECSPSNAKTGCAPQATPGTAACGGGTADLMGTGFYDLDDKLNPYACQKSNQTGGGMTGWLKTTAPATPGETLTIDFIIWDTGDQFYDSSVLLDKWVWKPNPVTVGTQPN
jgi:hypothetical protein